MAEYDESKDPIVRTFGPRFSLNRLVRQVHCQIESEIKTKLDRSFCRGLAQCVRGSKLTYKGQYETVEYSA